MNVWSGNCFYTCDGVASIIPDAGLNLFYNWDNIESFYKTLSILQGSIAGASCQCPQDGNAPDVAGGDKDKVQESDAEVGQRRSTRNSTK